MNSQTHTCCNKRIEEGGDTTPCCFCYPHDNCELEFQVKMEQLKVNKVKDWIGKER